MHLKVDGVPICEREDLHESWACAYADVAAARVAAREILAGNRDLKITIAPGRCPHDHTRRGG